MSAVQQSQMLEEGLVSSEELRASVIEVIDRLNPVLAAVVIPPFDRPGAGVPMLLKDAGQCLPHSQFVRVSSCCRQDCNA